MHFIPLDVRQGEGIVNVVFIRQAFPVASITLRISA